MCQYHQTLITGALQYSLKSGSMITPAVFFLLQTAWTIGDLLGFHRNFKIFCFRSAKNATDTLIRIALDLEIILGSIVILTILVLPIVNFYIIYVDPIRFFQEIIMLSLNSRKYISSLQSHSLCSFLAFIVLISTPT